MLTSTIKTFDFVPEFSREVDAIAVAALDAGAREAARVAANLAAPGLKEKAAMEVLPVRPTATGWTAGVRSRATDSRTGIPIAWFHNRGTLGSHVGSLKQPGRRRRAAEPGSGIAALRFFDAGRREGRKRIIAVIQSRI